MEIDNNSTSENWK